MWIPTEKLIYLDELLSKNIENYIKIFTIHHLVYNDYYHLINDKTLKEVYHLLEEIEMKDFIELNWFFNKETNIHNGWEELSIDFEKKFKYIFYFLNQLKTKIKNFPVINETPYIKNSTII
jgi:hypothetical protein